MGWIKGYKSIAGYFTGPLQPYDWMKEFNQYKTSTAWTFVKHGDYSFADQPGILTVDFVSASVFYELTKDYRFDGYAASEGKYLIASVPVKQGETTNYVKWYYDKTGVGSMFAKMVISNKAGLDEGTDIELLNLGAGNGYVIPVTNITTADDKQLYGFIVYSSADNIVYFGSAFLFDIEAIGEVEGEDFSEEYGEASIEEGYYEGTFDDSSDEIAVPDMPTVGITDVGFVNVYNPDMYALERLGEEIFPSFIDIDPYVPTGSDTVSALIDIGKSIGNLCSNIPNIMAMYSSSQLINYIIDCHVIPVLPIVDTDEFIKVGFRTLSQHAKRVTSDYVDFDCGSIELKEYYNNFIDYAPYTRFKLFLPFVGFVPIENEYIQNGRLQVKYRFNIIDGSFMAFIISSSSKSKLTNTVVAQYGGNACIHIPITGQNYASMASGIVAGTMGAATALSSGNVAGAVSSAVEVASAAPMLQSSNGYNATTSFLSVRIPYLVVERSVSNFSKNYPEEIGIPSNITTAFKDLRGYTTAGNVHLDGIEATEAEKQEISDLLAGGVIF